MNSCIANTLVSYLCTHQKAVLWWRYLPWRCTLGTQRKRTWPRMMPGHMKQKEVHVVTFVVARGVER